MVIEGKTTSCECLHIIQKQKSTKAALEDAGYFFNSFNEQDLLKSSSKAFVNEDIQSIDR